MYQHNRLTTNNFNFFSKLANFDYVLMACILLLGVISLATMYSTDGGKILFHTKSHFTKLIVFTIMMLIFSFINIKFWFSIGYFFYVIIIGLLIWTYLFGIKSSLTTNLIPSASVRRIPKGPARLGPILFCISEMNFLIHHM